VLYSLLKNRTSL